MKLRVPTGIVQKASLFPNIDETSVLAVNSFRDSSSFGANKWLIKNESDIVNDEIHLRPNKWNVNIRRRL